MPWRRRTVYPERYENKSPEEHDKEVFRDLTAMADRLVQAAQALTDEAEKLKDCIDEVAEEVDGGSSST